MIEIEKTELFRLVEKLRKDEGLTEAFLADTRLQMSVLACHAVIHESKAKENYLTAERQRRMIHALAKETAIVEGETAAKAEAIATRKADDAKSEEVKWEAELYQLRIFREQINKTLDAISTKLK